MQTRFSYANWNYFSGTLFAANLRHTVVAHIVCGSVSIHILLVHNVCHKFTAHVLSRTVLAHNVRHKITVRLVVNGATRNAQCATDNLSVILWGLWNAILQLACKGTTIWFWGGGGLSNFVWTDNLFSAWARPENLFSCGMDLGKFIFM